MWERSRHLVAAGNLSPYEINFRKPVRHPLLAVLELLGKFDGESLPQFRSKLYSTRRPMTVGTGGKLKELASILNERPEQILELLRSERKIFRARVPLQAMRDS
jgi:hypothetical protein